MGWRIFPRAVARNVGLHGVHWVSAVFFGIYLGNRFSVKSRHEPWYRAASAVDLISGLVAEEAAQVVRQGETMALSVAVWQRLFRVLAGVLVD